MREAALWIVLSALVVALFFGFDALLANRFPLLFLFPIPYAIVTTAMAPEGRQARWALAVLPALLLNYLLFYLVSFLLTVAGGGLYWPPSGLLAPMAGLALGLCQAPLLRNEGQAAWSWAVVLALGGIALLIGADVMRDQVGFELGAWLPQDRHDVALKAACGLGGGAAFGLVAWFGKTRIERATPLRPRVL